jgi:hypothetical protein
MRAHPDGRCKQPDERWELKEEPGYASWTGSESGQTGSRELWLQVDDKPLRGPEFDLRTDLATLAIHVRG